MSGYDKDRAQHERARIAASRTRDPNIFLQTVPANNFFPANNHFPVNNPLPANTSGFLVQPVSIVPSADSMFIKELPHQGNFTFLHFGGEIVNPFNPTFSPQSVMHLPKAAAAPGANVQPLKPDERNEHSLRLSQSKIPVPGSSMVQSQENMPLQTTTIKSESDRITSSAPPKTGLMESKWATKDNNGSAIGPKFRYDPAFIPGELISIPTMSRAERNRLKQEQINARILENEKKNIEPQPKPLAEQLSSSARNPTSQLRRPITEDLASFERSLTTKQALADPKVEIEAQALKTLSNIMSAPALKITTDKEPPAIPQKPLAPEPSHRSLTAKHALADARAETKAEALKTLTNNMSTPALKTTTSEEPPATPQRPSASEPFQRSSTVTHTIADPKADEEARLLKNLMSLMEQTKIAASRSTKSQPPTAEVPKPTTTIETTYVKPTRRPKATVKLASDPVEPTVPSSSPSVLAGLTTPKSLYSPTSGDTTAATSAVSASGITGAGFDGSPSKPKRKKVMASFKSSRQPSPINSPTVFQDPTNLLFFDRSSTPSAVALESAQARTLTIRGLPLTSTLSTIAGLIFGARIEKITYKPQSTHATVMFLDATACFHLCKQVTNGIQWPDKKRIAWIEFSKDVEPITGKEEMMIQQNMTRVIRAYGIDDDWGLIALRKLAARDEDLELEHVQLGKKDGIKIGSSLRYAEWRFASIEDAQIFKGMLKRDEDFVQCNVCFEEDPCFTAAEPRFVLKDN